MPSRPQVVHTIIIASCIVATAAHAEDAPPISGNEVIVIEDSPPPPKVKAKPKKRVRGNGDHLDNTFLRVAPPYSDRAIESDAWTVAWLFLDIDETGKVTRVKFLKYPGYDLEPIAVKTALALQFTPAIGHDNKPTRSYLVWPMEWPSHGWLLKRTGMASGIPDTTHVPCAGSAPWHMGALHKTYRDCTPPDWKKASSEPWRVK